MISLPERLNIDTNRWQHNTSKPPLSFCVSERKKSVCVPVTPSSGESKDLLVQMRNVERV